MKISQSNDRGYAEKHQQQVKYKASILNGDITQHLKDMDEKAPIG